MSEEPSEMLLLMKELVEKVKRLETTVYDNNYHIPEDWMFGKYPFLFN